MAAVIWSFFISQHETNIARKSRELNRGLIYSSGAGGDNKVIAVDEHERMVFYFARVQLNQSI